MTYDVSLLLLHVVCWCGLLVSHWGPTPMKLLVVGLNLADVSLLLLLLVYWCGLLTGKALGSGHKPMNLLVPGLNLAAV